MIKKIHIFGAAGSGASTLGKALSRELSYTHLDTDDYFWLTKFTEQRRLPERREMLKLDFSAYQNCTLSGAVCGWGDEFKTDFDLVIFL